MDTNFLNYVKQMRNAQKEYFKTHNRNVLQRCIMLEKIVDDMINDDDKKEPQLQFTD